MKSITLFILLFFIATGVYSQNRIIQKIEPSFWWAGMKNPDLQLLVYGTAISDYIPEIKSALVKIKSVEKTENKNYLVINLLINKAVQPGNFTIVFKKNGSPNENYTYELKARKPQKRGFSSADLIYLIMPDRFANGNPANDLQVSMLEKPNRENPLGRHGGDIEGIAKNLDYIKKLGATAIWLNPVYENDMEITSYHGYAITDFYNTDARFGSLTDYINLVNECHNKGIKVIKDMVFNHIGTNHYLYKDLPASDWVHAFPTYTRSNFRASILMDPYASEYDHTIFANGWFDIHMPDLNQKNKHLETYLIQNSIWWVELTGLDGIRMDTYPYPDKEMMVNWTLRMNQEYPDLSLLGETWLNDPALLSYFQPKSKTSGKYNSNLFSVTDFPMNYALNKIFNESEGWDTGLARLYLLLSNDFLYTNPSNNLIFTDNHDLTRIASSYQNDINKIKMALAVLFTMRGIPSMYYGTEIMMDGEEHTGHGNIRKDFPGGWPNDTKNAFNQVNLSENEKNLQNFTIKLANWRKNAVTIHNGKLKHFIPENSVYVYFRYTADKCIMVMLNNHNTNSQTVNMSRFAECLKIYKSGTEIISDTKITNLENILIPAKTAFIIELEK